MSDETQNNQVGENQNLGDANAANAGTVASENLSAENSESGSTGTAKEPGPDKAKEEPLAEENKSSAQDTASQEKTAANLEKSDSPVDSDVVSEKKEIDRSGALPAGQSFGSGNLKPADAVAKNEETLES